MSILRNGRTGPIALAARNRGDRFLGALSGQGDSMHSGTETCEGDRRVRMDNAKSVNCQMVFKERVYGHQISG
jgi:hypothetical protein